jgi:hypothetical protein
MRKRREQEEMLLIRREEQEKLIKEGKGPEAKGEKEVPELLLCPITQGKPPSMQC